MDKNSDKEEINKIIFTKIKHYGIAFVVIPAVMSIVITFISIYNRINYLNLISANVYTDYIKQTVNTLDGNIFAGRMVIFLYIKFMCNSQSLIIGLAGLDITIMQLGKINDDISKELKLHRECNGKIKNTNNNFKKMWLTFKSNKSIIWQWLLLIVIHLAIVFSGIMQST